MLAAFLLTACGGGGGGGPGLGNAQPAGPDISPTARSSTPPPPAFVVDYQLPVFIGDGGLRVDAADFGRIERFTDGPIDGISFAMATAPAAPGQPPVPRVLYFREAGVWMRQSLRTTDADSPPTTLTGVRDGIACLSRTLVPDPSDASSSLILAGEPGPNGVCELFSLSGQTHDDNTVLIRHSQNPLLPPMDLGSLNMALGICPIVSATGVAEAYLLTRSDGQVMRLDPMLGTISAVSGVPVDPIASPFSCGDTDALVQAGGGIWRVQADGSSSGPEFTVERDHFINGVVRVGGTVWFSQISHDSGRAPSYQGKLWRMPRDGNSAAELVLDTGNGGELDVERSVGGLLALVRETASGRHLELFDPVQPGAGLRTVHSVPLGRDFPPSFMRGGAHGLQYTVYAVDENFTSPKPVAPVSAHWLDEQGEVIGRFANAEWASFNAARGAGGDEPRALLVFGISDFVAQGHRGASMQLWDTKRRSAVALGTWTYASRLRGTAQSARTLPVHLMHGLAAGSGPDQLIGIDVDAGEVTVLDEGEQGPPRGL